MPSCGTLAIHGASSPGQGYGQRSDSWGTGTATLILCFLAALSEGFDIQSMGVAAPRLAPALALTRDQLGPVFSASLIGLLLGSLIVGRLSDRFGRKWTLILSLASYAVFSATTAWAHDLTQLLSIRVLAGLGLGGALPTLVALSSETLASNGVGALRRTRAVTMLTSGMPFGGAIAGGVAAAMDWRDIFYIGGGVPLVIAALMIPLLPESRVYIAARREVVSRQSVAWTLFGERRSLTTAILWMASFCALLSQYTLLNWLPTLMGSKGVSRSDASVVSLLYNLGGGVGVLVLAALLERPRRDWTVVVWYCAMGFALAVLSSTRADLVSAGAAGLGAGVFVTSATLFFYGLAPLFYPTAVRGTGVGAFVAVGRAGAIAGPLLAATLLSAGVGASGVLMALLPIVVIGGAASFALLRRPALRDAI